MSYRAIIRRPQRHDLHQGGGNMVSARAFVLAIVVLAVARAHAMPAPPSQSELISKRNQQDVADALKDCSAEATKRGEYKIIQVEFPYTRGKAFSPRIKIGHDLDRAQYWCAAKALGALQLEPFPRDEHFSLYDEVHDYALGRPQPLFPAALLPAWQRAGNRQDSVERALRSMLPAEVTVGKDGCLRLHGSPFLAPALDEWLRRTAGPAVLDSDSSFVVEERDHALAGDWWIRHRTVFNESGDGGLASNTICLEKLDGAAGALRRHRKQLRKAVGFRVLQAEWVVDSHGAVAGEIGFCLPPNPGAYDDPKTAEQLEAVRRDLEGVLRGVTYGPAPDLRRIVLGWGPADRLTTVVRPAREPLTRSGSALEAYCEQRQSSTCTRTGDWPELHTKDILRRCIEAAGVNAVMVDLEFDISPDGRVENVAPVTWMDGTPVVRQAATCVAAVFRGIQFPPSEGGACRIRRRLETFFEP